MNIKFKNYSNLSPFEHILLLEIRNEDEIRKSSLNKSIINLEKHLSWVKKLNNNNIYFAVLVDERICGGINLVHIGARKPNWGVFFDNKTSGVLRSVCTYKFLDFAFSHVNILHSKVLKTNTRSIKFTKNFGFEMIEKEEYFEFSQSKEDWLNNKNKKMIKNVDLLARKYDINFLMENK